MAGSSIPRTTKKAVRKGIFLMKKHPMATALVGITIGWALADRHYKSDSMKKMMEARYRATNLDFDDTSFGGLGKAGYLGSDDDDMFRKTGKTGPTKPGSADWDSVMKYPSGPQVRYDMDYHEQPFWTDPLFVPRQRDPVQPASVRNSGIETTVASQSTVFAGIDSTNSF